MYFCFIFSLVFSSSGLDWKVGKRMKGMNVRTKPSKDRQERERVRELAKKFDAQKN